MALDSGSPAPTILLVEDQAIIAMAQADAIRKAGYEVLTALSGEEAVDLATRDHRVDLVLMDINLGSGIDGTVAAERILERREIPIVFLSAYSDEETVARVRDITRYGYVVKNSGAFVLLSSIEMALHLFEAHQGETLGERRLARAQQLAGIGSYERDLRSGETMWSSDVRAMLGVPDANPSRSAILDLVIPEDREKIDAAVRTAREHGDVFDTRYRIRRPDGSVRWIHDRAEYWRDARGVPIRVFGILQDVTEIIGTHTRLEAQSEELDLALKSARVLLWRYDPEHKALTYTRGSNPTDTSTMPTPPTLADTRSVIHPEDVGELERLVTTLIDGTQDEIQLEYRVRGGGGWKRVLSRARRHVSEVTGAVTVIGATVDITE